MQTKIYILLPALVALVACGKNDADNATKGDENRKNSKAIVEYMEVEEPDTDVMLTDGVEHPYTFSEARSVFSATGGTRAIRTNALLELYPNSTELALSVDGVDQQLFTPAQSDGVTLKVVSMYAETYSEIRVPSSGRVRVRYADNTYGYIPDSVLVPAYPIEGTGFEAAKLHCPLLQLIESVETDWFKVTFDWTQRLDKIYVKPYLVAEGPLSSRTVYNARGQVLRQFLNGNTTYLYWKSCVYLNELPTFTVEVKPNPTGTPRSFTLGFPRRSALHSGRVVHDTFEVIQQ